MARGYDRPLYVLPFDHRASFETGMFGWEGALTSDAFCFGTPAARSTTASKREPRAKPQLPRLRGGIASSLTSLKKHAPNDQEARVKWLLASYYV